jgi:hypothetical protein
MHPHVSLRRWLAVAATLATTALGALPALATATDSPTAPTAPTAHSVCLLTKSDVQSSAPYQALPAGRRAAGDRFTTDICAKVDAVVASLTPQQKANLLAKYDAAVNGAVSQGWLTADQAATLIAMAGLV